VEANPPCPMAPGRLGRPRSARLPRQGRPRPGRPGPPRSPQHAAWGRADSGHATAAQTHRAGGDRDSAWSRSRTPHQARSPSGRYSPGCPGRPGRARPPTPAASAGRAAGRCVAPLPPRAARRWRLGWVGTAAPGRRHGQRGNDRSQPRRQLAAKDSPTDTDPEEDGDPPGQGVGPDGPLGRPHPLPGRLGGTARPAHAGPDPHRHHGPIGTGADQQLVRLVVAEVGRGWPGGRPG
jgi:hypothetical protein